MVLLLKYLEVRTKYETYRKLVSTRSSIFSQNQSSWNEHLMNNDNVTGALQRTSHL